MGFRQVDWNKLKDMIKYKIDANITAYQKARENSPEKSPEKSPQRRALQLPELTALEVSSRKTQFFATIDGQFGSSPPFTIQRLVELCIIDPITPPGPSLQGDPSISSSSTSPRFCHPHHRTLASYMQAISRVLSVTSPISAFPLPPSTPLASLEPNVNAPQLMDMLSPIPWLENQTGEPSTTPPRLQLRGRSPSIDKTDPPTRDDLGLGPTMLPLL
ncbi:hypothetical protein BT69DRAFT_1343650, partial [Atractiella rhizophila]